MKILFVCLGNICRSPIAQGILQSKADARQLQWQVDSAGTAAYHVGNNPHFHSQKVCQIRGIDISGQKARQFTQHDIDHFNLIFALDEENLADLQRIAGDRYHPGQIRLISDVKAHFSPKSIPDPYYGNFTDYELVFNMLDELCDTFVGLYSK